MDIHELVRIMNSHTLDIARYLLPNGKIEGHEYCVGNINGEQGKSLKIHIAGTKAGIWSDFAEPGVGGDLLDLWKIIRNINTVESIREIKNFLNIQDFRFFPSEKKYFKKPDKVNPQKNGSGLNYLINERKINKEILERYKIHYKDNNLYFPYIKNDQLVNYKLLPVKREDRKNTRTAKDAEKCLFGWHTIDDNTREIYICEGEIDAMTLACYNYPSLSVPFGAGVGAKNEWIENDWDLLERFDKIYLCMDSDEPGMQAAKDIANRLGFYRCLIVNFMPYKDINECHLNGGGIGKFLQEAKYLTPLNLKDIDSFRQELIEEFDPTKYKKYFSPHYHSKMTNVKFNPGEVTVWAGINGHGKTTILLQTAIDGVSQKEKFCIASLEQHPRKYIKKVIHQIAQNRNVSEKQITEIMNWLSNYIYIYDHIGSVDRENMLKAFEYANKRFGVEHFIIDSLTKCGFAEDDYSGQKLFVEQLTNFAILHNVHIHLVAHSRKQSTEKKEINKMDIKGSGAISDLASNVILINRNKTKENAIAREDHTKDHQSDMTLLIEKQREEGWEGIMSFYYDRKSEMFYEKGKEIINYFDENSHF